MIIIQNFCMKLVPLVILDQVSTENHNTHFMLNNFFFFKIRAGYSVEKYDRVGRSADDSMIWRMRLACWITEGTHTHTHTHTHSEYVVLIAFPRQQ